jgi:MFS family permease
MQNYWQAIRSFDRSIWPYFAMVGLIGISFFGFIGVLQNLYLLRLNYDVESIGLLIASGQLVWALGAFPAAAMGRRIGLKPTLLLSLGLNALAFVFFYAVEALPVPLRPAWLVAWNAVSWFASALFLVNTTPYLAGLTTPDQRGYAFAMQSAIFPLTAFVGGVVAGLLPGLFASVFDHSLDQPWPYRYGLWLVPVMYALAVLIFSRAKSVTLGQDASAQHEQARTPVAILAIFGLIAILYSIGDGVIIAFFNVYLDQALSLPADRIGAIIGIASLLPVVMALAAAPVMKRIGGGATFGLSSAGLGIFLAIMAVVPTMLASALSRMGTGAMNAIGGAARNVFSQDIVAPRFWAVSSAVSTVGLALGWALAAAAGGALIRLVGFGGLFLLSGLCALVAAMLTFGFLRYLQAQRARVSVAVERV